MSWICPLDGIVHVIYASADGYCCADCNSLVGVDAEDEFFDLSEEEQLTITV